MKNKKVRCEERNEKGFFEKIKDSYLKAPIQMCQNITLINDYYYNDYYYNHNWRLVE